MLTFLRKIRKSLIESGSARKYLIYAIGEIALVVIGILIALQINNWNEWRKLKNQEKSILIEINENVLACLDEVQSSIDFIEERNQTIKVVINHLTNDLPYHDSLNWYFYNLNAFPTPDFTSGAYETLKSKGLDLVTKDSLRKEIVQVFDKLLPQLERRITYDGQIRHQEYHDTEYTYHFKILSDDLGDYPDTTLNYIGLNSKVVPLNYPLLLKDERYESLLRSIFDNNKWFIEYLKEILEALEKLNESLAEE